MSAFIGDKPVSDIYQVDAMQFNKGGVVVAILLNYKKQDLKTVVFWRLITRDRGDTLEFCEAGYGSELTQLADMHTNSFPGRYGMPGSGFPRCSAHDEKLPGSFVVRMWANRELGESVMFSGSSKVSSGFSFVMSLDDNWIIIENKASPANTACYFNRGEKLSFRQNVLAAR
ncbi:MAG: hypothetical protein LCH80_01465 [Proteobacteria bacterium]|nr:hypothetical protein [Pseudomonadota bacterium]